jgi:hypothetical protein
MREGSDVFEVFLVGLRESTKDALKLLLTKLEKVYEIERKVQQESYDENSGNKFMIINTIQ